MSVLDELDDLRGLLPVSHCFSHEDEEHFLRNISFLYRQTHDLASLRIIFARNPPFHALVFPDIFNHYAALVSHPFDAECEVLAKGKPQTDRAGALTSLRNAIEERIHERLEERMKAERVASCLAQHKDIAEQRKRELGALHKHAAATRFGMKAPLQPPAQPEQRKRDRSPSPADSLASYRSPFAPLTQRAEDDPGKPIDRMRKRLRTEEETSVPPSVGDPPAEESESESESDADADTDTEAAVSETGVDIDSDSDATLDHEWNRLRPRSRPTAFTPRLCRQASQLFDQAIPVAPTMKPAAPQTQISNGTVHSIYPTSSAVRRLYQGSASEMELMPRLPAPAYTQTFAVEPSPPKMVQEQEQEQRAKMPLKQPAALPAAAYLNVDMPIKHPAPPPTPSTAAATRAPTPSAQRTHPRGPELGLFSVAGAVDRGQFLANILGASHRISHAVEGMLSVPPPQRPGGPVPENDKAMEKGKGMSRADEGMSMPSPGPRFSFAPKFSFTESTFSESPTKW